MKHFFLLIIIFSGVTAAFSAPDSDSTLLKLDNEL